MAQDYLVVRDGYRLSMNSPHQANQNVQKACLCVSRVKGAGPGRGAGDFKMFYLDLWAGVSATYPLWCMVKTVRPP